MALGIGETSSAAARTSTALPQQASVGSNKTLITSTPGHDAPFSNTSVDFGKTIITSAPSSSASISNSSRTSNLETFSASAPYNGSCVFKDGSIVYTGDCWDRWNHYWTCQSVMGLEPSETWWTLSTSTSVDTIPMYGVTDGTKTTAYTTFLSTFVSTYYNGIFPILTSTLTISSTFSRWDEITTSTSLSRQTYFDYSESTSSIPLPTVTPPPCKLPAVVSQCQSSWSSFASAKLGISSVSADIGASEPLCSQAAINGSLCQDVMKAYWDGLWYVGGRRQPGDMWNVSQLPNKSWTTTWMADYRFLPGCTIGCQTCRITGGTVKVLYWPPATSTVPAIENRTSTGNGADTSLVTAVGFGTTFTSPTVYISFDSLYASDSCSGIGKTHNATIIALAPTELSSIYYNSMQSLATASFNYTDLIHLPVPDSIYNSQPRCGFDEFWGSSTRTGPFTCDRIRPYEPILGT